MPKMTLSHFEFSLIAALAISVVLGVVTRKETTDSEGRKIVRDSTEREKLLNGLRYFGWFVVSLFGVAWLMKLGHG